MGRHESGKLHVSLQQLYEGNAAYHTGRESEREGHELAAWLANGNPQHAADGRGKARQRMQTYSDGPNILCNRCCCRSASFSSADANRIRYSTGNFVARLERTLEISISNTGSLSRSSASKDT